MMNAATAALQAVLDGNEDRAWVLVRDMRPGDLDELEDAMDQLSALVSEAQVANLNKE